MSLFGRKPQRWLGEGKRKGWLVVDGHSFAITDIELVGSRILLRAVAPGPKPAGSGTITIFGRDGRGIGQGGTVEWRSASKYDLAIIDCYIRLKTVDADPLFEEEMRHR
jgi:hypothetical protein